MSPLMFLLMAATAAFALYRTMRSRAENVRYLQEAGEDAPLMISHLSRPLQQLAHETRALRLSLEDPIRQLRALPSRLSPDFDAQAINQTLMNSSREIGDWLNTVRRLGDEDREHLIDLGVNTGAVRDVFAAEGFAFEITGSGKQAKILMKKNLTRLREELDRVETSLQLQSDPYR